MVLFFRFLKTILMDFIDKDISISIYFKKKYT